MNKKKLSIVIIIVVTLLIITGLWISGIIPKQIARICATNYLKKNYPKMQLEYVDIEWASSFGGYYIRFKDEKGKEVGFIMPYKYFPISPGQGTFALEDSYRIECESGIEDINDLYNHSVTDNYEDIRTLPQNYSKEQAQKDNCFIIGAMVHNDNLYNEFMDKYNKKETTFIRVVKSTVEGDSIITDVLYDAITNKIHLVNDNTRDEFSSQEDRTIEYKTYEKTGVWNYQNSQYWVAYNGDLPNGTAEYMINSDDLFIIATISSGDNLDKIEKYKRSTENVTIEVLKDTITPSEVSIRITDNNKVYYGWGVEFRIQSKINGEWKELEYITDELTWISIAYVPNADHQLIQKLNIEEYYGKLSSGTYRIVKPVYDNGYLDIYSNEFEVK